MEQLVNEQT